MNKLHRAIRNGELGTIRYLMLDRDNYSKLQLWHAFSQAIHSLRTAGDLRIIINADRIKETLFWAYEYAD